MASSASAGSAAAAAGRPFVQRVVEAGPLDRAGGGKRVDLPVGVLVVGAELLDLLPAGDGLLPALVDLVNVGRELEEVDVLRDRLDRFHEPLRQHQHPGLLGRLGRHPRCPDVPGIVDERVLAQLDRVAVISLRSSRFGAHQKRLVLGPDQHPDLARDRH